MGFFTKQPIVQAPRRPAPKPRSRARALKAELALLEVEDAFAAKQEVGEARRAKEIERAFKAATNATEFRKAAAQIDPAVPMEDKLALRSARAEYRSKVRKPVTNGAAPGPVVATTAVKTPTAEESS